MPPRAKRAVPSNPDEMTGMQKRLLEMLDDMYNKLAAKNATFLDFCGEFTGQGPAKAYQSVVEVLRATGLSDDDAIKIAKERLVMPERAVQTTTSIVQWRFDAQAMWRGAPKNHMVLKYAKSIASTRFRQDSLFACPYMLIVAASCNFFSALAHMDVL